MKRNFKKCFITGITGAGGSYLAEYILRQNKSVKIFGSYRSNGNISLLKKKNKRIKFFKIDLNNYNKLKIILKKIKPDLIFNFASNPDVRLSFDLPREFINNNYNSSFNLEKLFWKSKYNLGLSITYLLQYMFNLSKIS